ncbi:MAG: helix-turn-helix domain-containing protein [Candidatus Cloacimonadales bacterium]
MSSYLESLVELGLTELEAKIYLALLQKNTFTATELSAASGVNRTQTYDILAKLLQRGMAVESRGRVKKYSAVNPQNVLSDFEQEINHKQAKIAELAAPLSKMYNSDNGNSSLDFIQVLSSRQNIINKVEKLEFASQREILSFCKPPYMMNISFPYSQQRANVFEKRPKLQQKSIYQAELSDIENFIEWIKIFQDAGEEVRIVEKLPMKLLIFDQEKVVCTINNKFQPNDQFTAMFVDNIDLSLALSVTFYHYWKEAMTVEQFKAKYLKKQGESDEK